MNKPFLDTIRATNLCTLKEYIYVYPRLLKEYQKLGEDCSEMYFIEEQIEQHVLHIEIEKETQTKILDNGYKLEHGTFEDYNVMVRSFDVRVTSLKAIIEFLHVKKSELETQIPETVSESEPLDLSNTSAVEKIIYLNELGIIDFLRTKPEFMLSANLMATFLSAITDEKAATLQTSINRLINNDTDDKNHPYKTKGTVNKIRQTFIDKNIKPKTS